MLAKTYSAVLHRGQLQIIEIEVDARRGIPQLIVIGLASQALHEARERLLSALHNCGVHLKSKRTIINLAPAELKKTSAGLDLAMAVGLLQIAGVIPPLTQKVLWLGELALDGSVKPIEGCQRLLSKIPTEHFDTIVTSSVEPNSSFPTRRISHLSELISARSPASLPIQSVFAPQTTKKSRQFMHIVGQEVAKRALCISLAARLHCLLAGPPGIGKTLLIEAAGEIHTELYAGSSIRQPHHSISAQGMVGGGLRGEPGEVTLADGGVLLLDELAEFPRGAIEALREPLSSKKVLISRGEYHYAYPANTVLFATMNRCPCGWLGSSSEQCHCSSLAITNYYQRVSGAIRDRIDLHIMLSSGEHRSQTTTVPSISAVKRAIEIQHDRFHKSTLQSNRDLEISTYRQYCTCSESAHKLLQTLPDHQVSLRRVQKTIAISQTLADLEARSKIEMEDVLEALSYQPDVVSSSLRTKSW